jgi:hypothetical protein
LFGFRLPVGCSWFILFVFCKKLGTGGFVASGFGRSGASAPKGPFPRFGPPIPLFGPLFGPTGQQPAPLGRAEGEARMRDGRTAAVRSEMPVLLGILAALVLAVLA